MATWTQPRGASGPLDADRALDRGHARDGRPGRVLIVDDDTAVRLVCAVNLEAEGLRVLEAADGLDGLERACCERPDLVLTDVTMPGLDGFQLAEKLRRDERTRRIPLIFLSGEVGHANAQRARALGAVAYLTKPFDPRALAALVAHELAAARAGPSELTATVAS
ncbi:MAG TPA: response regulator [Gaiellaceae bacterium]|nr:response regulator [Gaiellaceae bacterium]